MQSDFAEILPYCFSATIQSADFIPLIYWVRGSVTIYLSRRAGQQLRGCGEFYLNLNGVFVRSPRPATSFSL